MAETFFCLRANPDAKIASIASIGQNSNGSYYPVDKGFEGRKNQRLWKEQYGITITSFSVSIIINIRRLYVIDEFM
ncbi:MAG: hypothetical protein AAB116_26705 [Candidatus Poribacteria bacterium]